MSRFEGLPKEVNDPESLESAEDGLSENIKEFGVNAERLSELASKEPENGWGSNVKNKMVEIKDFLKKDAYLYGIPGIFGSIAAGAALSGDTENSLRLLRMSIAGGGFALVAKLAVRHGEKKAERTMGIGRRKNNK